MKMSFIHKESVDGAKKKHQEHVRALKATLKFYISDPLYGVSAKIIITNVETPSKIIQEVLKSWNREIKCCRDLYKVGSLKNPKVIITHLHDKIQTRIE